MPTRPRKTTDSPKVARERSQFRSLLAANPNYFGSLPELGFPVELVKQGDTAFEALSCGVLQSRAQPARGDVRHQAQLRILRRPVFDGL